MFPHFGSYVTLSFLLHVPVLVLWRLPLMQPDSRRTSHRRALTKRLAGRSGRTGDGVSVTSEERAEAWSCRGGHGAAVTFR